MAKLVNWEKFEKKLREQKISLFSVREIAQLFGVSKSAATFLVHRYNKKGWIVRYKRGLYAVQDALPPSLFVANKLYEPSYISLEFALSYHGIIPETVYEITSVTTRATMSFERMGTIFSYRKIKPSAFNGYQFERREMGGYKMAEAEKAFVDLCYFKLRGGENQLSRFNKDMLDTTKAIKYANAFDNKKLISLVKELLK